MKRINLKNIKLENVEKLSREQLKNITGGFSNSFGASSGSGCNEDTKCERDGTYCDSTNNDCTCAWIDGSLGCVAGMYNN